jgi:isoamylase
VSDRGEGESAPLGATPSPGGVNFSVFSKHATAVELLLFDGVDDAKAARVARLDPSNGMRFDPRKVLLDPYARAVVVPDTYARDAVRDTRDDAQTAMKSVVADVAAYDWEGTRLSSDLRRGPSCTRCMCAGFTRHPSSGLGRRHAARSPV